MNKREINKESGLVSIVIPAYNEQAGIELFHSSLLLPALVSSSISDWEVLYVNDGSSDDTASKLTALAKKDKNVKIVTLSRNFGKEIAVTAGISESTGDAIIIMDADGQHPPEMIDQFIQKWRAGAQVVVGIRNSNQNEGLVKKIGSKFFYRILNLLSDHRTPARSTDYRLISKEVREEFLRFTERNRISRGLIDWLGFDRDYVHYDSPARLAGEATYTVRKLTKLAINSFTTLSLRPLFIFSYIGLFITVVSLLAGVFILVEQFVFGDPLGLNFTGSAMLGILISFLVGIILMAQGMMSVYMSHIYAQAQNRPLFVINKSKSLNLEKR